MRLLKAIKNAATALKDTLHDDCDANLEFYKAKVETLRASNENLKRNYWEMCGYLRDEMEDRRKLIVRFEQLARSRNRYRRKYVTLHLQLKRLAKLVTVVRELIADGSFGRNETHILNRQLEECAPPKQSKASA